MSTTFTTNLPTANTLLESLKRGDTFVESGHTDFQGAIWMITDPFFDGERVRAVDLRDGMCGLLEKNEKVLPIHLAIEVSLEAEDE